MSKQKLKNGLPVFIKRNKDASTVSLFLLIRAGSNYEKNYPSGIAHLLEHLFFKGNSKYSKRQVAEFFEYVGGGLRASTSKELMSFDLTVPCAYFKESLDMMVSLLLSPSFKIKNIIEEIKVVKQEIALYEDSPEDLLMDLTEGKIWKNSTLANPILGTRESLDLIGKEEIEHFYFSHFLAENMALACYGNISEEMLDEIYRLFSLFPQGQKISYEVNDLFLGDKIRKETDFSQNYFTYVYPANSFSSGKHWYEYLLCEYIGSGMNSVLYKKLREELQLIYDVSMYYENFSNKAALFLQLGADKTEELKILREIEILHQTLGNESIDYNQFVYLREKVKNQFIVDYADPLSKLLLQMRSELVYGKTYLLEDILDELDNLNLDEFNQIIKNRFLNLKYSLFQFV